MNKLIKKVCLCTLAIFASFLIFKQTYVKASVQETAPTQWQIAVEQAMGSFADKGGYSTGRKIAPGFKQTTWMGMDKAVTIEENGQVKIDTSQARPSFCSSAVYMLFLKSLFNWQTEFNHPISTQSWINLKPYTMPNSKYPIQDDGVGAWGMANANGPGFAVLINQLKMGKNYYVGLTSEYKKESARLKAFEQGKPFDVIKMFWNDKVGKDERGHIGLYLGEQDELNPATGKIDHYIYWWTSNGSKTDINSGYGIGRATTDKIKRAIFTRITKPENIKNVENLNPTDKNQFLSDIGSRLNADTKEVKEECGIKNFDKRYIHKKQKKRRFAKKTNSRRKILIKKDRN